MLLLGLTTTKTFGLVMDFIDIFRKPKSTVSGFVDAGKFGFLVFRFGFL